jgi:hypothetical protein
VLTSLVYNAKAFYFILRAKRTIFEDPNIYFTELFEIFQKILTIVVVLGQTFNLKHRQNFFL